MRHLFGLALLLCFVTSSWERAACKDGWKDIGFMCLKLENKLQHDEEENQKGEEESEDKSDDDQDEKIKVLEDELSNCQKKNEKNRAEILKLKETVCDCSESSDEEKANHAHDLATINELRQDLQECEKKTVDCGEDKDEVIESLEENLEEREDKVAELMEEIGNCTEQSQELNSQIAFLEKENGVLKEVNSNLEAENARIKEEKENIQEKVDELESEVESLKNEVDALNDEISNLEDENSQLKEEIENPQNKVDELESEVESLKNEVDGLKEENEELKKENSNLKDEVARLEAKLEECESEKSQEPDPGWYAPGNGYQYKALREKQSKESCVSACVKIDAELAIVGMEELDMRRDILKATNIKKSTWIGSKDKDVCEMVKGGRKGQYAITEEKCSEKSFCLCEKSL